MIIKISKGTLVQGKKGIIELIGDVIVEAERKMDGCYQYTVGAKTYFVAAGCCQEIKKL